MKIAFVVRERQRYPLWLLCRALGVSLSGYYRWHKQQGVVTPQQLANQQLTAAIHTIHVHSYGIYSSLRIHAQLRTEGW